MYTQLTYIEETLMNQKLELRDSEPHIVKTSNSFFGKMQFRTTFIKQIGEHAPQILREKNNYPISTGMLLGLNELIKTNDSYVEIRDDAGALFRLGPNSEFALELTVCGIAPVYIGKIYKSRVSYTPITAVCNSKYRTSCWIVCSSTVFMEKIDENHDIFFAFSETVPIWEYDESSRVFNIVTINEGEKVTLKFDGSKDMRNRYIYDRIEQISDHDYDKITEEFVNNKNWR